MNDEKYRHCCKGCCKSNACSSCGVVDTDEPLTLEGFSGKQLTDFSSEPGRQLCLRPLAAKPLARKSHYEPLQPAMAYGQTPQESLGERCQAAG